MRRLLTISIIPVLVMFLTGCVKDDLPIKEEGGENFNISLNISTRDVVDVRSATNSVERKIYHGYFFVFNSDGSYSSHIKFDQSSVTANESSSPALVLPNATRIVVGSKIVIVINEEAVVNENSMVASTYANVHSLFKLTTSGLVDAGSGDNTVKMSMYGEVDSWEAGNSIEIEFLRAKVQVKLASDIIISTTAGTSFDDATKIHYKIYNYATKGVTNGFETGGQGGPITTINWASEASTNDVTKVGTVADNDFVGASYLYPFSYSDRYLPYTNIAANTPHTSRLAIIVKADTKYYRLDLYKGELYVNLLANTHYKIIINSVTGPGYDSATEALMYPPSNLVYTLDADDSGGDLKAGTTTKENGVVTLSVNSRYDNYMRSDGEIIVYMDAYYKMFTEQNSSATPSSEAVKQNHRLVTTGHGLTVSEVQGTVGTSNLDNGVYWRISRSGATKHVADLTFEVKIGTLAIQKTVRLIFLGTNQSKDCFGIHNIELYNPYGDGAEFKNYTWVPNNLHLGRNNTVSYDVVRKLSIADNMTPTGWSNTTYSGVPHFELRYVHGSLYVNFSNGTVKTFMDRVDQQPPYYVGRTGAEITMKNANFGYGDEISTPTSRKYKHVIIGRYNEVEVAGGTDDEIQWGKTGRLLFNAIPYPTKPAGMNGWEITEHVRLDNEDRKYAIGMLYCYRRNGSKVGEFTLPTTWYLPAMHQLKDLFTKHGKGALNISPTWHITASESSADKNWYCNMNDGHNNNNNVKTIPHHVRCHREL